MDPADQWVFNPDTGSYELRSSGRPRPSGPGRAGTGAPPRETGPPRQRQAPEPGGRRPPPGGRRPGEGRAAESDRATSASRAETLDRTDAPDRTERPGRTVPPQRDRRASRSRRKQKKRSTRKRVLLWIAAILALLLLVIAAIAGYAYYRLNSNITSVDVPFDNPATPGEPVNILLIGSDERVGDGNDGYGDRDSLGHAETTVLLHFSKDRSHATALSIPRDLVVDIPDCETTDDDGNTTTIPGEQNVRFNESYGQQGRDPGCTWKTVQEMTGIEINHFMLADFNAVKELSTAVGGVEVCLEKDIDDENSKLQLPAGTHTVEGEDALAFVRTRDSVGHASDLSRIELQQQFLGSMARSLQESGSLTDPGKVWDLAEAVTGALTVDSGIADIPSLAGLGQDLSSVPVEEISFVTLPVLDNPDEDVAATVVLDEEPARQLFRMINEDVALTEDGTPADEEDEADAEDSPEPVPAADVRVDVFNGGNVIGAAQQTVDWFQNEHGMNLTSNQSNADEPHATTTLEYGADQAGQAATLADMMGLPDDALQQSDADAGDEPLRLILGDDFTQPGVPIEVPVERPDDLDSVTADESMCAS